MKSLSVILAMGALAASSPADPAATILRDGAALPFATAAEALASAQPGDTVELASGDHAGPLVIETDRVAVKADTKTRYRVTITAKEGDTVSVETSGIQNLAKGVYLFEPEGGKDASQSLVGVKEGPARVRAVNSFVFNADIDGEDGLTGSDVRAIQMIDAAVWDE